MAGKTTIKVSLGDDPLSLLSQEPPNTPGTPQPPGPSSASPVLGTSPAFASPAVGGAQGTPAASGVRARSAPIGSAGTGPAARRTLAVDRPSGVVRSARSAAGAAGAGGGAGAARANAPVAAESKSDGASSGGAKHGAMGTPSRAALSAAGVGGTSEDDLLHKVRESTSL